VGEREQPVADKPMFPNLGSTNDIWNAAIEAAAQVVERTAVIDDFDVVPAIRKLKRMP
jgi:hypothetical protein